MVWFHQVTKGQGFAWAALVLAGLASFSAPPASAQSGSCQEDLAALQGRRMAQIGELNKMSKASKGPMNAALACPKLRNLSSIEGEFLAYIVKNKEWCSIPDEIVTQFKGSRAKTAATASKACAVAAQMKKNQDQQANGLPNGAPSGLKLPAGPL